MIQNKIINNINDAELFYKNLGFNFNDIIKY